MRRFSSDTPAATALRHRLARLFVQLRPCPAPFPAAPRSTCPTRCARCSSTRRWASPRPPSATCRSSWRPTRASCPSGEEQGVKGPRAPQRGKLRVEKLKDHERPAKSWDESVGAYLVLCRKRPDTSCPVRLAFQYTELMPTDTFPQCGLGGHGLSFVTIALRFVTLILDHQTFCAATAPPAWASSGSRATWRPP